MKCQLRPGAGTKNQVTLHLGTSTQLWCVLSLPKPNTDVMRQADARHFLKTSNFSEPSRGAGCWEQDCRLEGLAFGVALCPHHAVFAQDAGISGSESEGLPRAWHRARCHPHPEPSSAKCRIRQLQVGILRMSREVTRRSDSRQSGTCRALRGLRSRTLTTSLMPLKARVTFRFLSTPLRILARSGSHC